MHGVGAFCVQPTVGRKEHAAFPPHAAGGGANPVDDGSRLPILLGQAQGGTMSFADIGSIIAAVAVLGVVGYFMYIKVLKH